jgi:hypothetical protein
MKAYSVTAIVLITGLTVTLANLDDTESRIEERYGKPFAKWVDYGGYKKAYRHNGYTITVNFVNATSVMERLDKADQSPISGKEIGHLLADNSGGLHWRAGSRKDLDNIADVQWETVDPKKRLAYYSELERVLTIAFPSYYEWVAEQRRKGFSNSTAR